MTQHFPPWQNLAAEFKMLKQAYQIPGLAALIPCTDSWIKLSYPSSYSSILDTPV